MQGCSQHEGGTSLYGTAPREAGYLIVEHPKPWPAKIKRLPGLVCELRRSLKDHPGEELKLLVTPEIPARFKVCEGPNMILLRQKAGRGVWKVLSARTEVLRRELQLPADGTEEPLHLVCTHGSRDRCCGTFGYPVYRALEARSKRLVIQVSHLGGHRYAPVVASFPEWRIFGHVRPLRVEAFETDLEAGLLPEGMYRGVGLLKSRPQVVEAALWERYGARFAALECLGKENGHHLYRAVLVDGQKIDYRARVETEKIAGYKSCEDLGEGKLSKIKRHTLAELEPLNLTLGSATRSEG